MDIKYSMDNGNNDFSACSENRLVRTCDGLLNVSPRRSSSQEVRYPQATETRANITSLKIHVLNLRYLGLKRFMSLFVHIDIFLSSNKGEQMRITL